MWQTGKCKGLRAVTAKNIEENERKCEGLKETDQDSSILHVK